MATAMAMAMAMAMVVAVALPLHPPEHASRPWSVPTADRDASLFVAQVSPEIQHG